MSHIICRNLRNPLMKSVLKIQNERSLSLFVPSTCAFSISQKRHYNFIFSPSKWFCMHEQRRWSNLDRPPWERLTIKSVEEKVVSACKAYDKINADKLTLDTHFVNDLGLDSLDHVEVIMAMEDEFGFEIPDRDAERLLTPRAIVQYVCDREDVYE